MAENSVYVQTEPLVEQCKKWFKLNRKARRQSAWMQLFKDLFKIIFPEINYCQLLVTQEDMFEHFQLFFNTSVAYQYQQKGGEAIHENPLADFLLCLEGIMEYTNTQGMRFEWKANQVITSNRLNVLKSEKILIKITEDCTFLSIDRKLMEKLKNDILRQDRQIKEQFMSNYLFCNFTPVYYLTNINVISIKQNNEVQSKNQMIYLLYSGMIKRKLKNKALEGTQLTKGCIVNCKVLSSLLQQKELFTQEESYSAKIDSILISFDLEQMARILKLNPNLKKQLQLKLKTIAQERYQLSKKSAQILAKFNEGTQAQNQSIEFHYSVQFKPRNIKSAQVSRSFRRTKVTETGDSSYGEFITFDKYDKMIESKQRVALTKHNYINRQGKRRERAVYTPDYEKKMKLQHKMMKIQTGKIQKISQRDSKKECNNQQLEQIKKNLFQVTHLFDEPFQDIANQTFESRVIPKKSKTFNNLSLADRKINRASNLKPQDYLKDEYFNEYTNKPRVRYSLKDIEVAKQQSNKQNPISITQKTDSIFTRKGPSVNFVIYNLQ